MRVLLLILFASNLTIAQQQATQNFIATGPASFAWNTSSLQSVTDIATCSTALSNTLIIRDTVRGGRFIKYTGSDAADNGVVFLDASGSKWKRATDGYSVNMAWWGTNRAALTAARDYIYTHSAYRKIYIPAGNYSISDSIHFNKDIIIEGDGVIGYPATILTFPANKHGLVFSFVSGQNGFGAEMKNISITGQYATPHNTSVNAITIRTRVYFTNVIINQFDGNGFHVSACGIQPNGDNNNYGMSDNSVFNYCAAYYCTNGMFTEGCDGHILDIGEGCDFSQNRRWGYYGNGLLGGDVLYKSHFAFNGVAVPDANSVVTYNTKYYVAKAGYDGYFGDAVDSNYNKQPDINPLYWHEVTPTMVATEWQNNVRYYSGGAAIVRNVNARTVFIQCYTEPSQPPVFLNTRSEWNAGNAGADVVGGIQENILYGEKHLYNGGFLVQKYAHVGTTVYDAEAQLKVYNDYSKTASRIAIKNEGTTNEISNIFKNNTGATGKIQYIDSTFKIFSKSNVIAATIDSAGITANKFFGDGSALTGVTGSGAAWGQITGTLSNQSDLQTALNGKQAAGTYATGTGSATGVNTGDNATNTQYSGLAASKQDALLSGTNIKTINGTTLLGSGDLVVSGAGASRVWLPGDVVNNNAVANSIADVTGLSFPVVAGTKYSFKFFIVYSSAVTTTGARWSINGPAATFIHYRSQYPTTATAITNNTALAGYNLPAASNASSLTANNIAIIEGIIQPSANGTVIARFASEISASAITAIGGRSYVEYSVIN